MAEWMTLTSEPSFRSGSDHIGKQRHWHPLWVHQTPGKSNPVSSCLAEGRADLNPCTNSDAEFLLFWKRLRLWDEQCTVNGGDVWAKTVLKNHNEIQILSSVLWHMLQAWPGASGSRVLGRLIFIDKHTSDSAWGSTKWLAWPLLTFKKTLLLIMSLLVNHYSQTKHRTSIFSTCTIAYWGMKGKATDIVTSNPLDK